VDMTIFPGRLDGSVGAVPSKSQAHRALICAALADQPTRIECGGESGDIAATITCLEALGVGIARQPDGYCVSPMAMRASNLREQGKPPRPLRGHPSPEGNVDGGYDNAVNQNSQAQPVKLLCGESGSTFRFLLPVVCATGRNVSFIPKGRLPQRPLSPLIDELVRHGCFLSATGSVPFSASGQLVPGRYSIDAGVSSQFISGLLFALPLLDGDSELHLKGRVESFPYIELTLGMLEVFGIEAEFDGILFSIPGGQKYRSPGVVNIEGDWSNAAFWLGAGAVGAGRITCANLDVKSRQGDRAILEILKRFGAQVDADNSAVTVTGGNLKGLEIDAQDIPDLVPILAVVAASAEGTTVIRNAGRLRDKESDRLAAITDVMCGLGAYIIQTEDGLIIHGGTALKGGRVSSHGDHRIAMAAAIAATICMSEVEIRGAEVVGKSYPRFFDDLQSLRIVDSG